MSNTAELYVEEETPSNEIKGFTKAFQRRSKEKRQEDKRVVELLGYRREGSLVYGARVTEKGFKNGTVTKVFAAANCDDLTLRKIKHYATLAQVEVVELDLDNLELAEKLQKPFLVSMVHVRSQK